MDDEKFAGVRDMPRHRLARATAIMRVERINYCRMVIQGRFGPSADHRMKTVWNISDSQTEKPRKLWASAALLMSR